MEIHKEIKQHRDLFYNAIKTKITYLLITEAPKHLSNYLTMADVESDPPFLEREKITYYLKTVIDLEGFLHAVTQIMLYIYCNDFPKVKINANKFCNQSSVFPADVLSESAIQKRK